ncbi:hypothetical protein C2869_19640 [Saccharobesus litoralis]|uniref:Competence protein CoiA-like N-terminal domain-containing protein n=1 Tax=Saccharobesus litoralis TaxID=2172099 RepID=A0A2S0VW80_9ALTE|nr:competence protein CoiA family protein [Saccharobesus litoralis]AWB68477.1 hypothetical protein C2869_19640 [Saccharobesus litoralis]
MQHLIPFGLAVDSQQLVDIQDVEQGAKCNCICPSCGHPLVARHGTKNDWHFAHNSHFDSGINYSECDYSWYSAIKLMLKQLFVEHTHFTTPDYYFNHTLLRSRRLVTQAKAIEYQHLDIERGKFDVILDVQGKKLGIFFEHKGRYYSPHRCQSIAGVIIINLEKLLQALTKSDTTQSTKAYLLSMLAASKHQAKRWVYHVRQQAIEQEIEKIQQAKVAQQKQQRKLQQAAAEKRRQEQRQEEEKAQKQRQQARAKQLEKQRAAQARHQDYQRQQALAKVAKQQAMLESTTSGDLELERQQANDEAERLKVLAEQKQQRLAEQEANLQQHKRKLAERQQAMQEQAKQQPCQYYCAACDISYTGTVSGVNPCPQCKSHLYRIEVAKRDNR